MCTIGPLLVSSVPIIRYAARNRSGARLDRTTSEPPHCEPSTRSLADTGILAGPLVRVQQYGKAEQRKILNDALIFLSAAKAGLTVLTRNISGFDLLRQLSPHGKVLFYDL